MLAHGDFAISYWWFAHCITLRRPLRIFGVDGWIAFSIVIIQILTSNRLPIAITLLVTLTLVTLEKRWSSNHPCDGIRWLFARFYRAERIYIDFAARIGEPLMAKTWSKRVFKKRSLATILSTFAMLPGFLASGILSH